MPKHPICFVRDNFLVKMSVLFDNGDATCLGIGGAQRPEDLPKKFWKVFGSPATARRWFS